MGWEREGTGRGEGGEGEGRGRGEGEGKECPLCSPPTFTILPPPMMSYF